MRIILPSIFVLALLTLSQLQAQTSDSLFFVFLNTNPNKEKLSAEKVDSLQAAHLQNIEKLAKEGVLLAAGPFDTGGGLFIITAENIEQANLVLSTDPAIAANRYIIEIYPFSLRINGLCRPKEPYVMVTYQFIRLKANPAFSGESSQMVENSKVFMENLNNDTDFVVVQGVFDDLNSGILVLNVETKDEAEEIIIKNPAINERQLDYEIKPLWIADGTFCKK